VSYKNVPAKQKSKEDEASISMLVSTSVRVSRYEYGLSGSLTGHQGMNTIIRCVRFDTHVVKELINVHN